MLLAFLSGTRDADRQCRLGRRCVRARAPLRSRPCTREIRSEVARFLSFQKPVGIAALVLVGVGLIVLLASIFVPSRDDCSGVPSSSAMMLALGIM